MSTSLKDMKIVPQELLDERLEEVKGLAENDTEAYRIVKDRLTGEHYLHYAYLHLNIADGREETFHHLLPLAHDDVLGLVFGMQEFSYPDHWKSRYLRNGPNGQYVWFDPAFASESSEGEKIADQIRDLLAQFKQGGSFDEQSMRKLFGDLDRLWEGKGKC